LRIESGLPQDRGIAAFVARAQDLGYSGLAVAHPYRRLIGPHIDELTEAAACQGSVDVVVFTRDGRAIGHTTDVAGFDAAFGRGLPEVPLGHVVQWGANAKGLAVARMLRKRGVERLAILDAESGRAEALVARLNEQADASWAEYVSADGLTERLRQADGLVYAADGGDAVASDVSLAQALHHGLWIFDARYDQIPTPLMRAGRALGCRVQHGGDVLVNGAASAFQLVTGLPPHMPHMFADFAELTAGPLAHT
jgi:shikimate dehydrogenase